MYTNHVTKAKNNESVYSKFKKVDSKSTDWHIIVIFYSALHFVDAFFIKENGFKPGNHFERSKRMHISLSELEGEYEELLQQSYHARYECCKMAPSIVTKCEETLTRIKDRIKDNITI